LTSALLILHVINKLKLLLLLLLLAGQDISVGITTGYELHGRGAIPGRGSVQTGSGVNPASYKMDAGSSFSGGKAAGA
jgi:hypothetical protein